MLFSSLAKTSLGTRLYINYFIVIITFDHIKVIYAYIKATAIIRKIIKFLLSNYSKFIWRKNNQYGMLIF